MTPAQSARRERSFLRIPIWAAVLTLAAATAPAQQLDWVRQFSDASAATDVWVADVEVSGNSVYVAGTFVAIPAIDCFVRKYDLAGNLVWSRTFGTSEFDAVSVLAIVGSEIMVGGVTNGAFPGFADTTPWVSDPFVRRYDSDGNVLGTMQMPRISTAGSGTPYPAFIDASGIYGTDAVEPTWFNQDVMVFKYSHAGAVLWTSQIGTSDYDQVDSSWPRSLVVDATGIYLTGSTQGAFPGQTLTGYEDAFVARLDLSGNLVWVRQSGVAEEFSWGSGVASDGSTVYASGMTVAPTGETILSVTRHDSSGAVLWTRELSSVAFDVLFAGIAADANGVCVAGGTEGTFPGFVSAGTRDLFARRLDAQGNDVWTVQFGSSSQDEAYAVAFGSNDTFIAGIARGAMPGSTVTTGAVLARVSPPAVVDADADGLSDADELARGTNPMNPDTDADGVQDGAEVTMAGAGSCPSPLDSDSDDDGLTDGVEVNSMGTSPCSADTDGDTVPDKLDPNPLVPGAVTDVVESILRQFADMTRCLPLNLFTGNHNIARAAKRAAVAFLFDEAAFFIHYNQTGLAMIVLKDIKKHLIGPNPSTHFMVPSPQRADMAAAVCLMIQLLGG